MIILKDAFVCFCEEHQQRGFILQLIPTQVLHRNQCKKKPAPYIESLGYNTILIIVCLARTQSSNEARDQDNFPRNSGCTNLF